MPDREMLLQTLRDALMTRREIREAYLFGSNARGSDSAISDVDVAVTVEPVALESSGYGYEAELGADLQTALQRADVDVVTLNRAPPLLYHRVLRDGIRIFARDLAETTTREARALSRYFDYIPQLKKIADAYAHGKVARG